jgi:hypothetical protein
MVRTGMNISVAGVTVLTCWFSIAFCSAIATVLFRSVAGLRPH